MLKLLLSSRLVRAGLCVLVVGTGPLFAIIVAAELGLTDDPNPNPIGPGILAFLTFWPGVIMIAVGAVRALHGHRSDAQHTRSNAEAVASADSLRAFMHGPLGRGLAGITGGMLLLRGLTGLHTEPRRGAAAAIALGIVSLWFAVVGQVPAWLRAGRRQ